ncbi:ribulose-phosphate 3-epimerase [Spiroplasma endosymbiont of Aspidapion aeneum]|uniref:ribulose-phosphate 3-epimerase n=1 Tax=Spiroplasma endosymbiont of Aspidapion aeneum TaxID=3066276 RepID=UPI00313C9C1D
MNKKIVAASIYVFNFLEIGKKLEELIACGVKWIHVDIMDGLFVNNYALCQKFCADIKNKYKDIIVDAHMMCHNSDRFIESFAKTGIDYFIFHYESITDKTSKNINSIIKKIKTNNVKPIIALNPETSISIIEEYIDNLDGVMLMNITPGFNGQSIIDSATKKISDLSDFRSKKNKDFLIMVDGGCREETYKDICQAGADVIVVGFFVNYGPKEMKVQVDKIFNWK